MSTVIQTDEAIVPRLEAAAERVKRAHKAARALHTGTVWINTYNLYDAASPYGGVKASGFGRESGLAGLDFYTQTKSVWVDLS